MTSYYPEDVLISLVKSGGIAIQPYIAPLHELIMSRLPQSFLDEYIPYFNGVKSKHSEHLPLMNILDVILVVIGYLVVVAIGKAMMSGFQRQKVKWLSLYQNTTAVALSWYMMWSILSEARKQEYSLFNNKIDESVNGLRVSAFLSFVSGCISRKTQTMRCMVMLCHKA